MSYNPNRAPKGTSTGGQFAAGDASKDEAGQVEDAFSSSPLSDFDEQHRQTQAILGKANKEGILTYKRLDSGDELYTTGRKLVGRSANGDRVYASTTFRHGVHDHKTTNLEYSAGSYSMAVTFDVVEKGRREPSMIGRDLDPEHEAVLTDGLRGLRDNHLNDMVAGTDAQMEHFREIQERPDTTALNVHDRAFAEIEPDRGYDFGSQWLYRPVDPGVYRDGIEDFAKLGEK